MQIHLKRGEKIYVNGAVLRIDRRASLEFLNDVNFLLEQHVMQADDATTPLRQLYFTVQAMLIDPANQGITAELYKHLSHRLCALLGTVEIREGVEAVDEKVAAGQHFEALRLLRGLFPLEAAVMAKHKTQEEKAA